jgi:hypothetical protein
LFLTVRNQLREARGRMHPREKICFS